MTRGRDFVRTFVMLERPLGIGIFFYRRAVGPMGSLLPTYTERSGVRYRLESFGSMRKEWEWQFRNVGATRTAFRWRVEFSDGTTRALTAGAGATARMLVIGYLDTFIH
jgi:hypothetical protein